MSIHQPSTGHVALVKAKRGSSYYARIRVRGSGGQQVVKKLGPAWTERGRPRAGYFTKGTAEAELRRMLADADRGTLAAAARKSDVTFADAAAEYVRFLRDDKEREESTVLDYEGVIRGYLLPRFGDRDVGSITSDDVTAYRNELKTLKRNDGTRRLSNRTIVRHLVVIHGIYRRAARKWPTIVGRNPAAKDDVDRPPAVYDTAKYETLTPDEVRLVAAEMAIPVEGALVITAAFSGLRLGELMALRWRDVQFELNSILVARSLAGAVRQPDGRMRRHEKTPKSGKVRSTPLVDEVIVALDRLSQRDWFTGADDLVFCNDVGGYLSDGMLRRRFYEALERAGVRKVRLHDLRHAFGTLAIQALPLTDVQQALGHAHVTTTQRYIHSKPRADDAARLQAVLSGNGIGIFNGISKPAISTAS